METREALLRRIIECGSDLEPLKRRLAEYPFDCEVEIVTLTADDVVSVLERFLSDEVSPDEVADWAELLHLRDDVGLESENDALVGEFLFQASTPEIFHELDGAWARGWIQALRGERPVWVEGSP